MRKTNFVIVLVISAVLGSTAIALSFAGKARLESKADLDRLPVVALSTADDGPRRFPDEQRIRPASLSSGVRALLATLGDRLEKPGKERVKYMTDYPLATVA